MTNWCGPLGFGSTRVSVAFGVSGLRLRKRSYQIAQTADCVLKRKLPCSNVNEEGGLKKQSGRTWTPAKFSLCAPKWRTCFYCSQLGDFQNASFSKSGGKKSRVLFCLPVSAFDFLCCFAFLCSDGYSSFLWEQKMPTDVSSASRWRSVSAAVLQQEDFVL